MSLFPTPNRVQLLRHINARNVYTDVDAAIETGAVRIVLDDPETGEQTTVTARVRELEAAGWCLPSVVVWRLTKAGLAVAYPPERTPGHRAIVDWSLRIHGPGDRHEWALQCAQLLDQHGADAQLPPFPSRIAGTRVSRDLTVRRLYREAAEAAPPLTTGGPTPTTIHTGGSTA